MHWDIFQKRPTKDIMSTNDTFKGELKAIFLIQLGELMEKGFSIYEAVTFCKILFKKQSAIIDSIQEKLAQGYRLDESLVDCGYNDTICSQIYLASQHGDFARSLITLGELLLEKRKQRRKLLQAIAYPIILLLFIMTLLIAIRQILLPQLMRMVNQEALHQNKLASTTIFFLEYLPQILLVLLVTFLCVLSLVRYHLHHCNKMQGLNFLMKFPVVKSFILQYYTFLYAREFSYFLANGQSLLQMVETMQTPGTSALTKEIATHLQAEFRRGEDMAQALEKITFFKEELVWLVMQASLTSQLEIKLLQYSKKLLNDFVKDIEKKITWIQPILFIFVGLMIVSIYIVLLLPTLTILEGGEF